jgi:hypothetical protein
MALGIIGVCGVYIWTSMNPKIVTLPAAPGITGQSPQRPASARNVQPAGPLATAGPDPLPFALRPSRFKPTPEQASQYDQAVKLERNRAFGPAMCTDLRADLWVASEGHGVQKYDPTKPPLEAWTQFTTKDGLGDDSGYAIACDKAGRIWVGHLNHGVSVFNGSKWQNFDVVGGASRPGKLAGPLGERVFHIAVDQRDGDVWIATNGGLSRYSASKDAWTYFTRADGLASDLASSMAFDSAGNIYVAMSADGVAMADFADNYRTWRYVTGPKDEPLTPSGDGLPSNLMNDILVARSGAVYATTDAGVAWSKDRGKTWNYIRGRDWADKVKQQFNGPPAGWSAGEPTNLLSEDYSTALAETADGKIVIGHRQTPVDEFDGVSCGPYPGSVTGFVRTILTTPYSLQGAYGEGIEVLQTSTDAKGAIGGSTSPKLAAQVAVDVHFPSSANVPSLAEFNAELAQMAAVPPAADGSSAVAALDDDWHTQGDWLGRYGRYWSLICGIVSPGEYLWGASPDAIEYHVRQGSAHPGPSSMQWYVSKMYSKDARTLELPPVYADSRVTQGLTSADVTRRQAEFNDHGESMPMSISGPGLAFQLSVPAGQYYLSVYFVDDDSQAGNKSKNRFRDFGIEVVSRLPDVDGLNALAAATPLASTRIADFWGGAYKRFLVQGPTDLTIVIDRNHSLNAKMSGVMLDVPESRPPPYFQSFDQWNQSQVVLAKKIARRVADWKVDPKSAADEFAARATAIDAAKGLSAALDEMRMWNPGWYAQNQHRIAVLLSRWSIASKVALAHDDLPLEESWLFQAGLFSEMEAVQRTAGGKTARDMEHAMKWNASISQDSGHEFQMLTDQILSKEQASIQPAGNSSGTTP